MQLALYGPNGFYSAERPAAHFRTSLHASPAFATAVARLVDEVTRQLGGRDRIDVVDVGSGTGELLVALAGLVPARVRLIGVELGARPAGLPERIGWRRELPRTIRGLLIANEWLDNVPLDIVELDGNGRARLVLVDTRTGDERPGRPVSRAGAAWLHRHWPLEGMDEGTRAEVGLTRDAAWTRAVTRMHSGLAIAVDYHHDRDDRPPFGTLTGFRRGREVQPVPDGTCDITAHVALDACAAEVMSRHGDLSTVLRPQRDVLLGLGVRGALPPRADASVDPAGYVRALAQASAASTLIAAGGLGGFGWLAHARGMSLPPALAG